MVFLWLGGVALLGASVAVNPAFCVSMKLVDFYCGHAVRLKSVLQFYQSQNVILYFMYQYTMPCAHLNSADDIPGPQNVGIKLHVGFVSGKGHNSFCDSRHTR